RWLGYPGSPAQSGDPGPLAPVQRVRGELSLVQREADLSLGFVRSLAQRRRLEHRTGEGRQQRWHRLITALIAVAVRQAPSPADPVVLVGVQSTPSRHLFAREDQRSWRLEPRLGRSSEFRPELPRERLCSCFISLLCSEPRSQCSKGDI